MSTNNNGGMSLLFRKTPSGIGEGEQSVKFQKVGKGLGLAKSSTQSSFKKSVRLGIDEFKHSGSKHRL